MTTAFNLNLPSDIPWLKLCSTDDMMDRVVCDLELPPKWASSIVIFKYVPANEYQAYADYNITYLKVAVTISGYQALDDEIQGEIDWDGIDVSVLDGITNLLNTYHPCTGAILQIVVGPKGSNPHIPIEEYPFFLTFEPKKRELYEMATDTKERQSRSVETLNLTKSAGNTQSTEVLDVDMGSSWNFGMQSTYAGTGGGFNIGSSNQGQWGSKSVDTQQNQVNRTAETGTEKRETFSHTTQLSQMYHLLDSYHLGTNRAVFFVQPRPHVLEEPSGFVRGPRKVEGIQEFFLVVAQLKEQEPFCVSARLDTGHLIETDILEYDHKTDISDLASVTARVPTRNDIPDGSTKRQACFLWECWDVIYKCFKTRSVTDQVYTAPDGYVIEGFSDLVNESSNGSTAVTVAPGAKNLTVHAEAEGHICFEDSGLCVDCPDEIEKRAGSARRQVQINLVSEEPTVKVGTQQQLLITTRGLCCCPEPVVQLPSVRVTGVYAVPSHLGGTFIYRPQPSGAGILPTSDQQPAPTVPGGPREVPFGGKSVFSTHAPQRGAYGACACQDIPAATMSQPSRSPDSAYQERRVSIRQANGVIDFIHDAMIKSFRDPRMGAEPKRFIETDLFAREVESHLRRTRAGRAALGRSAQELVPGELLEQIAKFLGSKPLELRVTDVLHLRNENYKRIAGLDADAVADLRLRLLGVARKSRRGGDSGRGGNAAQQ